MKKLLLLLLAFPLLGWIASAEEPEREVFPRSNAIWNVAQPYNPTRSFWYGLVGDTVINDTTYQKLYQLRDSSLLPEALGNYIGGIRQENKSVWLRVPLYYMDKSIEFVLCDFSKGIGDTVYSPRVYVDGHDEFLRIYIHSFTEKTYFVINSISMDEKGRKHVFVNGDYEEWIEGIGSTTGLFWYYLAYLTNGQTPYPHLKCMKYNDEVMYLDNRYASCNSCFCLDQITVGIEEITTGSFSISSSKLGIRIESEIICPNSFFELYDLSGVLVLSQSLTELETLIALENLPQGVYLYRISNAEKNTQSGKIILQ